MDYEKLTIVMRKLSLLAGDKIMEIYNSDDFEIKTKSDDSPVTAADEAADTIISQGLRREFPDALLITEEQSDSHALKGDTFLIVDPLDGTKEFIHRRGDFTVNIAYVENGVPTRGVVYAPAKGRMFFTLADGSSVEETVISTKRKWAQSPLFQCLMLTIQHFWWWHQNHIAIRQPMITSTNTTSRI